MSNGETTNMYVGSQTPREESLTTRLLSCEAGQRGQLHTLHSIMNDIEDGLLGPVPRGMGDENEKAVTPPGVMDAIILTQSEVSKALTDLETRLVSFRARMLEG